MGHCAASQNHSLALPAVDRGRFSKLFLQFVKGPACRFGTVGSNDCGNPGLEGDDQQKDVLAGFIDGHSLSQSHNTRTGTGSAGTAKRLKQDMANAQAGFLRRREPDREGGMPNGQNSVQTNVDARLSDSPDCLREGREKTGAGLDG